jgi:hypothetical protein
MHSLDASRVNPRPFLADTHCFAPVTIHVARFPALPRLTLLCTGGWQVGEPCVMCAMALVHSRVRRVVFAKQDEKGGALGSRWALQSQAGLNHHYTVYTLDPLQALPGDKQDASGQPDTVQG